MKIKILGIGCPNCKKLEANTKEALKNLNIKATIEKITEISEIVFYGVMSMPALVVDEEVKAYGRIPEIEEIEEIIREKND